MAQEPTMRRAVRRISQAFYNYARDQHWAEEDFAVFVKPKPDWGKVHVIFLARQFPGGSSQDGYVSVVNFIEKDLEDQPELRKAITLVVRTFDEMDQGGVFRVSDDYFDASEFVSGSPAF